MTDSKDDEFDAKNKAARLKANSAALPKHLDEDEDEDATREPRKLEELKRIAESKGMHEPMGFNNAEWDIWLRYKEETNAALLSYKIWGSGLMLLGTFASVISFVYFLELCKCFYLITTELRNHSYTFANDPFIPFLPFVGIAVFSASCIFFGFKLFMTPITVVRQRENANHSAKKVLGISLLILVIYGLKFYLTIKGKI